LGQVVHVELFDPGDKLVAASDFKVDLSYGRASVLEIPLQLIGQPTGQWRAVASWSAGVLERQFEANAPKWPVVAVWRGSSLRVLGGDGLLFCDRDPVSTGQTIGLFGTGFSAGRSFSLGTYLYDEVNERYPLVTAQVVTTDAEGKFATFVVLDASYVRGRYLVAAFATSYGLSVNPLVASACFRIGED
jgi:hypothetical protein